MTAADITVRRLVTWSPALVEQYTERAEPNAEVCNAAIGSMMALADRLVAGADLLTDGQYRTPTERYTTASGEQSYPVVGLELTRAANGGNLQTRQESTQYALALCQCARELRAAQVSETSAGALPLILVEAAACIVAGLAVDWIVTRATRLVQAERARHEAIAQAGRDYAERLRVHATTGTMPPPSEMERTASQQVTAAAEAARESGIGQTVDRALGTVTQLVVGGVVVWAGVTWLSKGRS